MFIVHISEITGKDNPFFRGFKTWFTDEVENQMALNLQTNSIWEPITTILAWVTKNYSN